MNFIQINEANMTLFIEKLSQLDWVDYCYVSDGIHEAHNSIRVLHGLYHE